MVPQRLREVRQDRAIAGEDVTLRRHTGDERQPPELGELGLADGNADAIVTRAAVILHHVARDTRHRAAHLWRRVSIEGGQPKYCALLKRDLIDVLCRDASL